MDRNEAVIQQMVMQAAVKEAVERGAPIPFIDRSGDMFFGPPEPVKAPDGRIVHLTRWALLRPYFSGEDSHTGFFMPAYMRSRSNGFCYPADQYGVRPFIGKQVELEVRQQLPVEDDVEVTVFRAKFRSEVTITEIHVDRILECQRVPCEPWMFLRVRDAEAFLDYVQGSIDEVSTALDLLQNEDYVRSMQELFVEVVRSSPCDFEGCDRGEIVDDDSRKSPCPECMFRGRQWPKEDQETSSNDASTGLVSPSGDPVSSTD
jgi:hypothetical protein